MGDSAPLAREPDAEPEIPESWSGRGDSASLVRALLGAPVGRERVELVDATSPMRPLASSSCALPEETPPGACAPAYALGV